MACTVTINYDATPVDGTPSQGSTFLNQSYAISVSDGDFIGEMVADGGGFSPCPGVGQFILRARNTVTGEIIGSIRGNSCHNLIFKSYTNSCPPTSFDCINGACIKNSVYSTPGFYKSLSECETACGTGCSGKCISNADWVQIESLSNQIMNKICS